MMIIQECEITLTEEEFSDIIDTAGYGIAYWCHRAIVDPDTYEMFYYDDDSEKSALINVKDVGDAMAKIVSKKIQCDPVIAQYILEEDIDAYAADVIVQVAAFGDIIYG